MSTLAEANPPADADGPLAQVWSVSAGKGTDGNSRLTAPPIVAGGLVYVLDAQNHVFAFDAQSGKPAWDKSIAPTGEAGTSRWYSLGLFGPSRSIDPAKGFGGGLAYDGGKIYAA